MSMSDPVANMLTKIRNGIMASHDTVDVPSSRLRINIAKILKSEGFIKNYKIISDKGQGTIKIFLKYDESGEPIISGLRRVSKPSCRVYARNDQIPMVQNGFGINILSTSKGVMTDKQARKMKVGGEILCAIW
jgi:small subunit ribosomal protein S8